MKLTAFSRILIVALILGAIFFGVKKFQPQLLESIKNNSETTQKQPPTGGNPSTGSAETQGGSSTKSTAPDNRPIFNYTAPEPVNGKIRGVVELGAAGFNSFIVNSDDSKRWKLEKSEFGSSLVHENMATDNDIRSGLKNYIAKMLDYGVKGKDIHFVVSSGAKNEPSVVKISNNLKEMGYFVNEVTPEQEGTYALKCVMPQVLESESFVIDIGSGNTKISYSNLGKVNAFESYGSKYSQKGISDDQVYQDVRSKVRSIPSSNRKTCLIIGGIPFELAKQVRDGKERYTVLKTSSEYTPNGDKQRCGLNIYKAIADETGCKTFVFDWDANFTIGFLLGLK
ncbi:MAG: hypothetical protein HOP11_02995 [Saprospiraceae bacterium]|nr:hypothetical protein [Saprospiraceae bacterium]